MAENLMVDVMVQTIPQLEPWERRRVADALKEAIAADLDSSGAGDADACPRCGCPRIVKKGRGRGGSQRWLCHGCGRTFSAASRSVLGMSKLPAEKWMLYAECMVDGLTLRNAADKAGVCLKTSFFMRHRICECMESMLPAFEAGPGCSVEVDETHVRASLTGNHAASTSFRCPVAQGGAGATGSSGA